MISKFLDAWDKREGELREKWAVEAPQSYAEIVKAVVGLLRDPEGNSWEQPDPERITEIDHGHYQGTLLYVIGAEGYQPSTYWGVSVGYGSCSGCDVLQDISCCWSNERPNERQLNELMGLARDVLHGLRCITGPAS